MYWSGREAWPLLVLAGTGAAIGIAITSCGLWGKVGFVVKKRRDYVLKVFSAFLGYPGNCIVQFQSI